MAIEDLLAKLRGEDPDAWHEASQGASELCQCPNAVQAVCDVLREGSHELQRSWAAYILRFGQDSPVAAARLYQAFQDPEETPQVRGDAAESLTGFKKLIGRRKLIAAYMRGLDDPSPMVRFWCIYGLMALDAKRERARLQIIAATDEAACPGFSKVATEAKLALASMDRLALQDRVWPGPFHLPPQLPNPTRAAFTLEAVKCQGAIIVRGKEIIAEGADRREAHIDPTAQAEVVAIREACRLLQTFDLSGCEIYCATEPDSMSLGAIYWARLKRIYYAAPRLPTTEDAPGIPTRNLLRRQGRAPFEAWAKSASKIRY